jgi:hypothetical protein
MDIGGRAFAIYSIEAVDISFGLCFRKRFGRS